MALKQGDIANFKTLKRACLDGDLALVESRCTRTGEYRAVLCAVEGMPDGSFNMVPFGHMATGNPYEDYADPGDAGLTTIAVDKRHAKGVNPRTKRGRTQ